jgi:signal transduction histidine kinase
MNFEPRSVMLVAGQMFIVLSMAVLAILFRRHARLNLLVWTIASISMGLCACMAALRDEVPDWLSVAVANVLAYGGLFAMAQVLRLERGLPARWGQALALWLGASSLYTLAWAMPWPTLQRQVLSGVLQSFGAAMVAVQAWRLALQSGSVSARLIGLAYAAYAAAAVLRALRMALDLTDGLAVSPQPDFLIAVLSALLAALFGSVGYLGMALDRARQRDLAQREALEQLREAQRSQELSARARAAVRGERHRSSQVLAHEVRQPLHNAAVSLQVASTSLEALPEAAEARRALLQAQAVIRRVSATLDNTVAAATLLTSDDRLTRHEVDLEMLVGLCMGDLPPDGRRRVQVEHRADVRSARMEPGLVRLALRNLLINATLYAPGDSPVLLRLLDSDEPLALVLEVADQGPGLPDDVRAALVDPDTSPPLQSVAPGHGLGLHIVQRVAVLHGGRLTWQPNVPGGSVFRLVLPQAMPD